MGRWRELSSGSGRLPHQYGRKWLLSLNNIEGTPVVLTAWSPGHYVGWVALDPNASDWPGADQIIITLKPLPEYDNSDYDWFSFEDVEGSASCGLCHREYAEWQADQHSQAAINHRFLTMYTGTDVAGREGQPTQWGKDAKALPPEPDQPYYGPGFLLDNPNRTGNCATCHTPMASQTPNTQNCPGRAATPILQLSGHLDFIGKPASPLGLAGDARRDLL
jgi:hypothetical protein